MKVRAVVPLLACAVQVAFPLAVPEPVIVSQGTAPPVAFHEHPLAVVTLIVPVPPVAGMVMVVGDTVKEQGAAP